MSQTWSDYTAAYRSRLVKSTAESVMAKASNEDEVVAYLSAVVKHIARNSELPVVDRLLEALQREAPATQSMPESQSRQLLENLGRLRQSAGSHHSQLHLPRLSGSDLDFAVVHSGISWDLLNRSSYNIGKTMYRSVSKEEAPSSSSRTTATVGRKSKINDEKVIAYVRTTLHKYSNDSSKVVVVRHQGVKRLVCARLLTKRLGRIWQEEPELRKLVGISALRRIVRVHFPSYRKPGRKTDVCSHCRTFKRHIVPRAEKEYNKRRAALVSIAPNYFDSFDQDSNTVQLLESARTDEIIVHAWKYITSKNSQSATDASRKQLSVGTRLELFESEAKACHKLKGHCELLEAYSWHQQSAERQREFSKELLLNLPNNEAYLHFDFKENVRYPMAKEETGAEFHAQNKLSITVFGCTVYAPGRRNFNFLLLSEVLDHDSQMAKLLLSRILEVVRGKPEYEWSKVRRLHLVCDCGPHFRSRESYAFYLHDLPKELKVPEPSFERKLVFRLL